MTRFWNVVGALGGLAVCVKLFARVDWRLCIHLDNYQLTTLVGAIAVLFLALDSAIEALE